MVTLVFKSPLSKLLIFSAVIFLPATAVSLITKNLSPVSNPPFALGPFGTTFITLMVSFIILNSTPIPKNTPAISSFTLCNSPAGIYTECGSSLPSRASIAVSFKAFNCTSSTYLFSIRLITSSKV